MSDASSLDTAKHKIARFCAYQERNKKEVFTKLKSFGLSFEEVMTLMDYLEEENFINEERYVNTFVRSKFQLKKWGRLKIAHHLKGKDIPASLVEKGLAEINAEEYQQQFEQLAQKKAKELIGQDLFKARKKVLNYLLSKGYEMGLVKSYCFNMAFEES